MNNTFDPANWHGVLQELGCDREGAQPLFLFAQCDPGGRAEAKRLIWQMLHRSTQDAYAHPPSIWAKNIRNARQALARPPETHKDWQAWTPGTALGWHEPLDEWYARDPEGNVVLPTDWNKVPLAVEEA